MVTVDRMLDAVNTGETDAFVDLFAPDGSLQPQRGFFTDSFTINDVQPTAQTDRIEAWMATNDAWDFEAEVISCTADPAEPLNVGQASDGWIECQVASRWPKLALEVTERWRFELRGERLVHWQPVPLDLDPSEREMPVGYPGLLAWEAWLEANHPEDAALWLNPTAAESGHRGPS